MQKLVEYSSTVHTTSVVDKGSIYLQLHMTINQLKHNCYRPFVVHTLTDHKGRAGELICRPCARSKGVRLEPLARALVFIYPNLNLM